MPCSPTWKRGASSYYDEVVNATRTRAPVRQSGPTRQWRRDSDNCRTIARYRPFSDGRTRRKRRFPHPGLSPRRSGRRVHSTLFYRGGDRTGETFTFRPSDTSAPRIRPTTTPFPKPLSIVSNCKEASWSDRERTEFESNPYYQNAVHLRKWDDLAKVKNLENPRARNVQRRSGALSDLKKSCSKTT